MTDKVTTTTEPTKDRLTQSRLAWLSAGVLIDYALFKPVRSLKPAVYFILGFSLGMIYSQQLLAKAIAIVTHLFVK